MEEFTRETPCGSISVAIPDSPGLFYTLQVRGGRLYEPATVDALCAAVSPGDVVYDIGARWGYFTTIAAACGARAVHAFEGGETRFLEANATDRVTVHNAIVTESDGIPADLSPPDVVVIDIEGDELRALRLLATQDQLPRVALVEVHPMQLGAGGQGELVDRLEAWGYDVSMTSGHRWGPPEWRPADTATAWPLPVTYLLRARVNP